MKKRKGLFFVLLLTLVLPLMLCAIGCGGGTDPEEEEGGSQNYAIVIQYKFDGVVSSEQSTQQYTSTADYTLKIPDKSGYKFIGWSGDVITGLVETYTIPKGSSGPKVFTANFEKIEQIFNITINYRIDGVVSGAPSFLTYGSFNDYTLTAPEKDGYIFIGWSGDDIEGIAQEHTITKINLGDKEFTAWYVNINDCFKINIRNCVDGVLSQETSTQYYSTLANYTIKHSEIEGYEFIGWSNDKVEGLIDSYTIPVGSEGDKSFVANFAKINKVHIKYVYDEVLSEQESIQTYTSDKPYTLQIPESDEFVFIGWSGDSITGMISEHTIPKGSVGDKTFTANFSSQKQAIIIKHSFNGAYEVEDTIQTYSSLADYKLRVEPIKNYDFIGWTGEDIVGIVSEYTIPKGSEGTKTFVANYVYYKHNATITYDVEGTLIKYNQQTFYSDSEFTLVVPTISGYKFLGWSGDNIDGMVSEYTIAKNTTQDCAFVAHFEKLPEQTTDNVLINYNLEGKEFVGKSQKYTNEKDYTLTIPIIEGYKFVGWSGEDIDGLVDSYTISKDSTGVKNLVANFERIYLNVKNNVKIYCKFDSQTPVYSSTQTYMSGQGNSLNIPSFDGYIFVGWSGEDIDGLVQTYKIPAGTYGEKVFTANYISKYHPVKVKLNIDGEVFDGTQQNYSISQDTTLVVPKVDGYVFIGWSGEGIDGLADSYTIEKGQSGQKQFTANYVKNVTLTATIDFLLGSTSIEGLEYKFDLKSGYTLNPLTIAGYTFVGYSGDGIVGEPVKTFAIDNADIINRRFTATFTKNQDEVTNNKINIIYNIGGKEVEGQAQQYDSNADYALQSSGMPWSMGYRFDGFSGDGITGKVNSYTIPKGTTGELTFTINYAKVTEVVAVQNYVTVNYKVDEATAFVGQVVAYSPLTDYTLSVPTLEGYEFIGWSDGGFSGIVSSYTIKKEDAGDKEITANFTKKYQVNISLHLGTESFYQLPTQYYTKYKQVKLSEYLFEDYDFVGWSGSDIMGTVSSYIIPIGSTGDKTFEANYSKKVVTQATYLATIKIKLDDNAEIDAKHVNFTNNADFTLIVPKVDGYEFIGWTGSDIEGIVDSYTIASETATGDKVFVANYKRIDRYKITINYKLPYGTVLAGQTIYYSSNESLTLPAPRISKFKFINWTSDTIPGGITTYVINKGTTGDITLTANFEAKKDYIVRFDTTNTAGLTFTGTEDVVMYKGEKLLELPRVINITDYEWAWYLEDTNRQITAGMDISSIIDKEVVRIRLVVTAYSSDY